tara:strand:- start:608 stop:709 length:102 start_codon:yes stop_codon:yes gene_type:complete
VVEEVLEEHLEVAVPEVIENPTEQLQAVILHPL